MAELLPKAVVVPYSTCVSDDSLVAQLMVAPIAVMTEAVTAEITVGVVSVEAAIVVETSLEKPLSFSEESYAVNAYEVIKPMLS